MLSDNDRTGDGAGVGACAWTTTGKRSADSTTTSCNVRFRLMIRLQRLLWTTRWSRHATVFDLLKDVVLNDVQTLPSFVCRSYSVRYLHALFHREVIQLYSVFDLR